MRKVFLSILSVLIMFPVFACEAAEYHYDSSGTLGSRAATSAEIDAQARDDIWIPPSLLSTVKSNIVPVDWISVKNPTYGALGDGSTDDTTAIQAAATAAANKTLFFPNTVGNKYVITSKITVPHTTNIIMDGCYIEYQGSANSTALEIGSNTTSTCSRVFRIKVRRQSRVWNNTDNIGVKFINMRHCDINLNRIANFTTGVQMVADAAGFVYNKIDIDGDIANNVIGVELVSINNGWASDNVFNGGGFQVSADSADENATTCYGVKLHNNTSTYSNKNNIFISPSFEMGISQKTGGAEAIPFLIDDGEENQVYGARHEGCSDTFARLTGSSPNNFFQVADVDGNLPNGDSLIDETGSNYTGNYLMRMDLLADDKAVPIFLSGQLVDKICYYDGNSSMHVAGMHCIDKSDNATYAAISDLVISGDFLRINGNAGIGIFVDTVEQKEFILSVPSEDQPKGSIAIRCYDENGTILTSAMGGHPYVKGRDTARAAFSYSDSICGGAYHQSFLTGQDNKFFSLGANVAEIAVMFLRSATGSRLKSFNLFSVGGLKANVWAGYEEIVPGANIGTCAPTAGTWETGKVVWNAAATNTAAVEGWRCYLGGTPGSWASIGPTAVKKSEWLPFNALKAPGTKPATFKEWGISGVWEFSDATDDTIVFNVQTPVDMDKTVAPAMLLGWSTNTAVTSETAVWQLEYLWTSAGEDTTAAAQETLTVSSNATSTANGLIVAEITGVDLPAAADACIHCRVKRLGADGGDDLTDTSELHGACFKYTIDKLGEAL